MIYRCSRLNRPARALPMLALLIAGVLPCAANTGNWPANWVPPKDQFTKVFSPFQTDMAALSRDGRYIAYSIRHGEKLSVVVVPIDHPARATCKVTVGTDRTSTPPGISGHLPARVLRMQWAPHDRLIIETNQVDIFASPNGGVNWLTGRIFGVDADGRNARALVGPRTLAAFDTVAYDAPSEGPGTRPLWPQTIGPAPVISVGNSRGPIVRTRIKPFAPQMLGLSPTQPEQILVFGSRYYHVDARTGKVHGIATAAAQKEIQQIKTQRQSYAPERQAAVAALETVLPGRKIVILGHSDDGNRYLALARTATKAGAFYVYDRPHRHAMEFVRRSPALDARQSHLTYVAFTAPDGVRRRAVLVLPRVYRVKPYPMIVYCPQKPDRPAPKTFARNVRTLSDMGFAVLLPDGIAVGRKPVSPPAMDEGVAALLAAVDSAAHRYPVDAKDVALFGNDTGALLAVRALELHPDRFRCVVAFNPGIGSTSNDWNDVFKIERSKFGSGPTGAASRSRPVMMLSFYGFAGDMPWNSYSDSKWLAHKLRGSGTPVDFVTLYVDYESPARLYAPSSKAAVYRQIDGFLNEHIYHYSVKTGPAKVRT